MVQDDTISLDSHVDLEAEGGQIDMVAYATALAFSSAALPPNLPDWIRATIEAKASAIRDDPSNGFASNAVSARAKDEREQDEFDDLKNQIVTAEAQRQQRERETWSRTQVTVGGQSKTGEEWATLARLLRDDDNVHNQVIELFRKRGMSDEEAEAHYDRITQAAEIAAIPPAQRTEEQKAVAAQNDADPTFKRDMDDVARVTDKNDVVARTGLNQSFTGAVNNAQPTSPSQTSPAPAPKAAVIEVSGPAF